MSKIKVFICDDSELICLALRHALEKNGFEVVGSSLTAETAIDDVRKTSPHVVLMDLSMPDVNGIAATRSLVGALPSVRVIILTCTTDPAVVFEALEAGAFGYAMKSIPCQQLTEAIQAVARGCGWLDPHFSGRVVPLEEKPPVPATTSFQHCPTMLFGRTEEAVLKLMSMGTRPGEICGILDISEQALAGIERSIFSKLVQKQRTQDIASEVRAGLFLN